MYVILLLELNFMSSSVGTWTDRRDLEEWG